MRIMHCIVCDVQDGCSSFLSGQVDQARLQHADDDNADADDDKADQYMGEKDQNGVVQ